MALSQNSIRVIKGISICLLVLLLISPAVIYLPPGSIPFVGHSHVADPSGLDDGLDVTDRLEQYKLGSFFDNGTFGKPQDYKRAAYWYGKAAAQGLVQAQMRLGFIYYEGNGVPKNMKEAFRLLTLGAEGGQPIAQTYLCMMYEKGEATPIDFGKAFYWCQKAADQQYHFGQFQLGLLYLSGHAHEQDIEKGLSLIREASRQGIFEARQLLQELETTCPEGIAMRNNCMSDKFSTSWGAVDEMPKKEVASDAEQDYSLALRYVMAEDNREPEKAFYWMRQAASKGSANAEFYMGQFYYEGFGVERNYPEALKWLQQAAAHQQPQAEFFLCVSYKDGNLGLSKDGAKSFEFCKRASDHGNAAATYQLGVFHLQGVAPESDVALGAELVHKGAAGDRAKISPQYQPAVPLCLAGNSAVMSKNRAAQCLFAAGGTDARIEFLLGNIFSDGMFVSKNATAAERWYRRAAERGHRDAQGKLAKIYADGSGVTQDKVEAYAWQQLFTPDTESGGGYDVSDQLTADEKQEAKSRADKYRASYAHPAFQ